MMDGGNRTKVRSTPRRNVMRSAEKLAFRCFTEERGRAGSDNSGQQQWLCCEQVFSTPRDLHRHASLLHRADILACARERAESGSPRSRHGTKVLGAMETTATPRVLKHDPTLEEGLPTSFTDIDAFTWLPQVEQIHDMPDNDGRVLLFYKYRDITNTEHVRNWQETLCKRLHLTGKVRIGTEGINATVSGSRKNTDEYIHAVREHPLFVEMTAEDFKESDGAGNVFPDGLKVGVYPEIVPMGVAPDHMPYFKGGVHLSVEDFHKAAQEHVTQAGTDQRSIFIDCRNFYESKIGHFERAVCPDIRKFSYWPEYVDQNTKLFENKKVYMYCTGGIRCERGSAYLLSKGVCKDVYQLQGGIHKYIERYPQGHFKGRLFVFDNRYSIGDSQDVVCVCRYCQTPWDQYQPCTSPHCHQLVLSCVGCRKRGLTACCQVCRLHAEQDARQEQCECTHSRVRIPVEDVGSSAGDDGNIQCEDQGKV